MADLAFAVFLILAGLWMWLVHKAVMGVLGWWERRLLTRLVLLEAEEAVRADD